MRRVVAIIPARLASTRLPEKVLASLGDRPMLVRVAEAVRQSTAISAVYVATGDQAVVEACNHWRIPVLETPVELPSGTDRVALAARGVEADVVVNVQADEPTISPGSLDALVRAFSDPEVDFASLMSPLEPGDRASPHRVKVWCTPTGDASCFSRRDDGRPHGRLHVGVYAYRWDRLQAFAALPPSPDEVLHRLEQLRALAEGWPIRMVETPWRGLSVDTASDLRRARAFFDRPASREVTQ